jgi:hypothetical protein
VRIPSETVQRIAGTFIDDSVQPSTAVLAWIQAECRVGSLKQAIQEAVKHESEPLRVDLTIVEKVEGDKITLRIPAMVSDHESPSTFEAQVRFELNPLVLRVTRI